MHTADDSPSSYIGLPIPELLSDTPPTTDMNSEDHLQAMEEELMKHWMKANAIEISLQAILDKLNIPPRKEDVMQSRLDFRKLESEEEFRDSQRKADEGMASVLAKVKPFTVRHYCFQYITQMNIIALWTSWYVRCMPVWCKGGTWNMLLMWHMTKHRDGCLSPTGIYQIDVRVSINFIEVCMYRKCSLLIECRVVNDSNLLRKKQMIQPGLSVWGYQTSYKHFKWTQEFFCTM